MSFKFIEYKGKRIFYVDYRNKNGDQNMETLDEVIKEVRKWTRKELTLSDFRNATASPEFMARIKKLGAEVFAPLSLKSAVIGITGVKNILLRAYNLVAEYKTVPFDTEEEAKEWLVKD